MPWTLYDWRQSAYPAGMKRASDCVTIPTSRRRFEWLYDGVGVVPNMLTDQPVFSSEKAVTIPSMGSLVPGWLLTFPRRAALSLRDATICDRKAVLKDSTLVANNLRLFAPRVFYFEHGPSLRNSMMGCGLDLAHLHTVPLDFDLVEASRARVDIGDWQPCSIDQLWNRDGEYLAIWESGENQGWVCDVARPVSQFFRRVIADRLECPTEWDYRENPHLDNIWLTRLAFA